MFTEVEGIVFYEFQLPPRLVLLRPPLFFLRLFYVTANVTESRAKYAYETRCIFNNFLVVATDQTLAHAIIMAERATFGPFADFTSVCMRDRAFEQPVSFWIVYLGTLADDTV